ncbi:MAG: aldo/keto reductase family protein [Armatimonadetes bacterium]|nr:aldo/keto reductase family protein [Armatimonadota bacterium]
MEYRKLGKYGLKVSEVALGGWLTHGRTLDDSTTERIVRRAFELGVNFFDSADVYHGGEAEKTLSKSIRGLPRENLVIATKCFFPMSEAPNDRGLSRKHIVESVHGSLKRLQVDYVDLYQFHRFDPDTPLEETVRAIDDMVRQGKVLYWGVSMWPADKITEVCAVAREWGCTLPVSNQPVYNMLQRDIESGVMGACEAAGMGLVVFSPLAQGVLTGKYRPGEPPAEGTRGSDQSSNMFMANHMNDEVLAKVQALSEIAARSGCTTAQLALAWCLRRPAVSSVIVGATKTDQIEDNAVASGLDLSSEVWSEVDRVLS